MVGTILAHRNPFCYTRDMTPEPRTLGDLFRAACESHSRPDRFLRKRDGTWQPVSSAEFTRQVRACAAGLASLGLGRGDRVAILSYNRLEWAVVDYACQLLGIADVPIYSTLPPDQCAYILKDSEAKAVFAENAEQAAKVRGQVPHLVTFESVPDAEPFAKFLERAAEPPAVEVDPEDLATLIYTSGTTGMPKGVMLTHRNLVSNVVSSCSVLRCESTDVLLSFLPLSHSFERIMDYALFWCGASIAYAEHVDKVVPNMIEVRPTVMAAVPRFYEKVYAKVQDSVRKKGPLARSIFEWARRTGAIEADFRRRGAAVPFSLGWRVGLARWLVLGKIQNVVGGRMKSFISGGGPLSRDVAEYLYSLGFTILEGYGLTETAPVLTLNPRGGVRLGSVGPAIPGIELKIAADGEILARGPNIMKGYLNRPDETKAVFQDGWFATGDIGELDAEGYLRITDRKKDLLKTSGGKYVAPQPIENALKCQQAVLNAVVIGDRQKFPAALIVPAPGSGREDVQKAVDAVNAGLAHHEQLKKFALVEQDFTIEGGELTPTLKVKRRVVEKKYQALIDEIYAGKEA
jgi:long-chain acyl-CoA synthetase